ncbi:MAG: tetratricopeptide repeat protein [Holophagae bacterium]|jgi:hypothetical protein
MWAVVLVVGAVVAGQPEPPCDRVCQRTAAEALLDAGDTRTAIDRLKTALDANPDDRTLTLMLARAYLLDDNLFWAERTISAALDEAPDDTEFRAWLAAIHLRQGDPELAADDLDVERRPTDDPLRARWRLLEASLSTVTGDRSSARSWVDGIATGDAIYPEDAAALTALRSSLDPWWSPVLTGTLDLGGGRTSNALAGSPTDPGATGTPSAMLLPELRARLAPRSRTPIQPIVDLELLGQLLRDEEVEELSTLIAGLRVGGARATERRRVTVAYHTEALFLDQDSALYSEAHRGEFEVEWASGSMLFGGAGHRAYRDERRTRWEGDVGLGGPIRLGTGFPVVAGVTLRLADARSAAYDQLGLSAAVSTMVDLGRRTSLQVSLSAVWDDYFNSGGQEGLRVFGTEDERRDLLGRITLIAWAPTRWGLRPGLELRVSRRDSTADDCPGFDFSYDEWRAVVWLRWTFGAGTGLPPRRAPAGHVPLDWGLEPGHPMPQERILDLLRRDEELRRGSSCVLP